MKPDEEQRWEYRFFWARDGWVYHEKPVVHGVEVEEMEPTPIELVILKMGSEKGFQFCGSYLDRDGLVLVFKRQCSTG